MCLTRCHPCRWLWRRCCCFWRRRRRGKFDYEPADAGGADKFFKLVLVGGRVGKTTLRHMFAKTSNPSDAPSASVSGADPYSIREMDMGEETISLQICECTARDMKSQDSDGQITMPSLQLADGIFLVYDVTDRKTLTQLKEMMLSGEVLPHLCRAAHVLVVGTKSDLDDGGRDIPTEEGKAFADRIGAGFVETSAMSGENVSKALWLMVASVVESVGGGKGKKKRRRGMPWSDTARLRTSLKKTPRRVFSAQALRLSLLAGVGQATLSSEGSESTTETQGGKGAEWKGNSSKDESRSSMPSPISSVGSAEAFFTGGNDDSSSRDQYGSDRGVLV